MAFNWTAAFAILLAAELVGYAAAATYVVGDGFGWGIPPNGVTTYANYAAQHVFTVGDVLVFNFTTGQHDVARVTKSAYDGCSSTSPLFLATVGPANVTLNTAGEDHYICTFGQHCSLGQKLAINVTASSPSPAPAPPPTPPSTTPSPTPIVTPPTPIVTPPTSSPSPAPGGRVTPPAPAPAPAAAPGSMISPPAPTPGMSPGTPSTPPPTSELTPPPPPSSAPVRTSYASLSLVFASMIIGLIMM